MRLSLLIALSAGLLFGCDDGDPTDDSDTDTGTETEAPAPEVTFTGTTTNLLLGSKAAEGLCVDAVDPSAALEGGELNVLASTTVAADGSYKVEGVDVSKAPLAIFMIIRDCGNEGTVYPSGTGVAAETYASSEAGDELTRDILFLDSTSAAGLDQSMAVVGYAGNLDDNGAFLGFVLDSDGSTRLGGATVSCTGCDNVYYLDTDPNDGLLSTGTAANTETAAGVGVAVIPGGPVTGYSVNHPSKEFDDLLFGSIPGLISFAGWTAK